MLGSSQNKIKELFLKKDYDCVCKKYSPKEIPQLLDFQSAMIFTYELFSSDYLNDKRKQFGYHVFLEIKKSFPDQWKNTWRNEALLGLASEQILNYRGRYEHFKNAYEQGGSEHPGLLIHFSRCCKAPGEALMSYEDALTLVDRAMKEKTYLDGAWAYCSIYFSLEKNKESTQWKNIALKMTEEGGESSPYILPHFIQEYEVKND